ncbi:MULTISPECIES: YceD family protein [Mycolicibacterium]|uniref:Putative metal-binding protein, possibly nucleic-acid binding protein n=1 Tax=Mycolicibacterium senegalense TaxID=1796 RepID=A0A378T3Q5_9MYCO|nr:MULTISPECIES: DUF177 domain-containing protein [Mycolicibacterium]MCV7335291.1 DUF177 domain-containing protein [Mycolicibacterium senegalense]MDR7291136.1 uncharacterized protein [Mycolicibacterium senegalense]QZA22653.1 DUF177 domain-containing protein [Mycolicibacterium senegalense]CDP83584.1 putative metal-binding protein, possibly nucleic-acid binding protein [Mycolicibacterium farcinogenes]STZ55300.1 putative metal-binding protein, possibly nucleic-acid binding protein [Mycolicibacter
MATHAKSSGREGPEKRTGSRSPLVIDVSRLGRRPGSFLPYQETVPSPVRIGVELVAIEKGAPLELDLQLQSVSEGVLVSGTVSAPTVGECARCLTELTGDVQIELTELYAYPDSTTDETTEADEMGRVGGSGQADTVDLEQPIIDAVGLALPFSPLCRPDCPGLCPDCGVALATAEPGHHHDKIDPRWAKLAAMLPDEERPGGDK